MSSVWYDRARAGDPDAIEAVVADLRSRVERMAAYYGRCSGEDPDDLLQEGWLGLLEALPNLDLRIGSSRQYLVQRAKWRILDAIKRARLRRCDHLDAAATERLPSDRSEDPSGAASVGEFTERLKDTHQRILGCLMDGLTWREAGETLGCTSANIAYHMRQIRREYEQWSGESLSVCKAA